jgi:uncharacterized protein (UPF0276 family)
VSSITTSRREQISRRSGVDTVALGVGFVYIANLPSEIYSADLLDFVEVTPESLCSDQQAQGSTVLTLMHERLDRARIVCDDLPMVVHGVELSIGSAHAWNAAYLSMLDTLKIEWPFLWHSEHLSFQSYADARGIDMPIGTPLPLPMTREAAELVSRRAAALVRRYDVPFLLENPAHCLIDLPGEPEIPDEFELMNQITASGDCGHLLDLHNLYCNAVNHGFDAFNAVERFALDRVMEIHVAGGRWESGYYMDTHDSETPEPVWDLLQHTLSRCPNIAGIVFELLEPHALRLGASAIVRNLERARNVWTRHHPSARGV